MFSTKHSSKALSVFSNVEHRLPSLFTAKNGAGQLVAGTNQKDNYLSKRTVWTLSPLVEEANKVTLWRCERFFPFNAKQDPKVQLHYSKPTQEVEEKLRKEKATVDKREATIIVNGQLPSENIFNSCWNPAHVRVCADGGANRLYNFDKQHYVPDHIIGDLDSATRDTLEFYKSKGVAIVHESDQDSTDLQKALALLKKIEIMPHGQFETVTVMGALGGCFSHEVSNLNSLYHFIGKKLFMISPRNVAFLLHKGKHLIRIVKHVEDHEDDDEGTKEIIDTFWSPPSTVYCGLLPLGEKCLNASTKGLRWDIKNQPLEFGGLVSVSNEVLHNVVEIEVSSPVVWTFDFRNDYYPASSV